MHVSRGRPSNRGKPAEAKAAILSRYEERYQGFGPTLAAEKLQKEGYNIDHETLRRWLIAQGTWKCDAKEQKHRKQRPPKEHFGEMVQMDGSDHKWMGQDHPATCVLSMIDDATGITMSLMAHKETTEAAMTLLKLWIQKYGIPLSLYCDKKNVYQLIRPPTVKEHLEGIEPASVFERACAKLGIEIIPAHSPQAKGRIERNNRTLQDRFVKELQLEKSAAIEDANKVLLGGFNDELNARFAHEPIDHTNFHRPLDAGIKLNEVFCWEHTRTVYNDWTVRNEGRVFQIEKDNNPMPAPRAKVIVRERLDHSIQILYKNQPLVYTELPRIIKKKFQSIMQLYRSLDSYEKVSNN